MEKVINLLYSEKKNLTHKISHHIEAIEKGKAAIKDLQSPEFVERNKNRECWSEDWTIHDYIKLNVDSNNRAIEDYSKRLAEMRDYLSQIERALKILKSGHDLSAKE
jgi:predicted RNase H-like nuclease (RuvC/YqgF family)